jgi:hypothetical protein
MISGEFKAAPMDTTARVVTILMVLMAGAFPLIPEMPVYAGLLLPVTLFITWLFSVRGFTVEEGLLIVQRPLWQTEITLPPDAVIKLEPDVKKGLIKTMGNGGIFGYTGRFRNRDLGGFRAFATDWNTAVSITGDQGRFKVVITPENPEMLHSSGEAQYSPNSSPG